MSDWINIRNKLPPDNQDVLILAHGDIQKGFYRSDSNAFYSKRETKNGPCWYKIYLDSDTHWTPGPSNN